MLKNNVNYLLNRLKQNGYSYIEDKNILNAESNSVFIGSCTNVFLEGIYSNEFYKKSYTVQPCLKCHNLKNYDRYYTSNKLFFYKSFFEMIGVIECGRLDKEKIKLYCDLVIDCFGINKNNVLVVLPEKFRIFEEYIKKDLGIIKVKIENRDELTTWRYGLPFLKGIGITFYTVYEKQPIQFFDIVEIEDERFSKVYVEAGFAIDNFRIYDKTFDRIELIFNKQVNDMNITEEIYYDSLVAIAEIYCSIEKKCFQENQRQKYYRERFSKYLLACGSKLGKSVDEIVEQINIYLKYSNESANINTISKDFGNINVNIENSIKAFNKYINHTVNIDIEYAKATFGVLEIQLK